MYTPQEISNQIIVRFDLGLDDTVTHMALQKLLYYAQGWNLAFTGERLFDEEIQAWCHGPVTPSIYQDYKHLKYNPIIINGLHKMESWLLDLIVEFYGNFHPRFLRNMTHQELPWMKAWEEGGGEQGGKHIPIEDQVIRKYFLNAHHESKTHAEFLQRKEECAHDLKPFTSKDIVSRLGYLPQYGSDVLEGVGVGI